MQERRILQYFDQDDIPASAQEVTTYGQQGNVLYIPVSSGRYDKYTDIGFYAATNNYSYVVNPNSRTSVSTVDIGFDVPTNDGSEWEYTYCRINGNGASFGKDEYTTYLTPVTQWNESYVSQGNIFPDGTYIKIKFNYPIKCGHVQRNESLYPIYIDTE